MSSSNSPATSTQSSDAEYSLDNFLKSLPTDEARRRVIGVLTKHKIPTNDPVFELLEASGLIQSIIHVSVERLSQVKDANNRSIEEGVKQIVAASNAISSQGHSSPKVSRSQKTNLKLVIPAMLIGSITTGLGIIPLSIFLNNKIAQGNMATMNFAGKIISANGENILPSQCEKNIKIAGITPDQINKIFPDVRGAKQVCVIKI